MTTYVGTSGWHYADWRGAFYDEKTATRDWLKAYARTFPTVENNNAFYRLPERSTFEQWREQTPPGFVVAVKASRYLTHVRRLKGSADPVRLLLERAEGLGDRLGPFLLQLPPNLKFAPELLDETLSCFPKRVRVAVEVRHPSWFVQETQSLLTSHNAAFCLADRKGPITPLWKTADWGYLRLHEGRATPHPAYGRAALRCWADRLGDLFEPGADVFVYFNNDTGACAPPNASTLMRLLERRGVDVARPAQEDEPRRSVTTGRTGRGS